MVTWCLYSRTYTLRAFVFAFDSLINPVSTKTVICVLCVFSPRGILDMSTDLRCPVGPGKRGPDLHRPDNRVKSDDFTHAIVFFRDFLGNFFVVVNRDYFYD